MNLLRTLERRTAVAASQHSSSGGSCGRSGSSDSISRHSRGAAAAAALAAGIVGSGGAAAAVTRCSRRICNDAFTSYRRSSIQGREEPWLLLLRPGGAGRVSINLQRL